MAGIGYPDGQRLQQQQALDPVYTVTTPQVGNVTSTVFYAGDYGYLLGDVSVAVAPLTVIVAWWNDATKDIPLGTTRVALDSGITSVGKWAVPIQAPYFTVSLQPLTGATAYSPTCLFCLTNTARPRTFDMPGELIYLSDFDLAAAGTLTKDASFYASGKVGVYTLGGTQGVSVELDQLRPGALTWTPINGWAVAAGVTDYREITLPASATRAILTNPSGAAASTGNRFHAIQSV